VANDLLKLSAAQAVAEIQNGAVDPTELFAFYNERIKNETIGAYLSSNDNNDAAEVGAGKPLGGVPIAIKDLFCVKGIESRAASKILDGYVPPYSATAVVKLAEAGASILGKTNMDEFAMGSSNENSAFGAVKNPWDETRVPGGSSGGSAAAVAAGLAPWATGTDTGGSIRQPASLCGLVGLKPTYGAVSRYGMIAFASSLDQAGPITRDVTDAALMLKYMQGADPSDSTSIGLPDEVVLPSADNFNGLKFGVPTGLDWAGVQAGVKEVFDASLKRIEAAGGEIVEVPLPHAEFGLSAYYLIAPAEASANLARMDGVRFGKRADSPTGLTDMYERTRGEGFGPEVKRRILLGTYSLSAGYYDAYYRKAQQVRTLIARDFMAAFEQVDAIVTPMTPTPAWKLGEKTDDPISMYLADIYTVAASLAGICGISVPRGETKEGLPIGVQVLAGHFEEAKLLRVAQAIESAQTKA
jgi:aspartyl-tRNA(Asn)/glutamyl-tRNA(Gln) amidotransferase subunit A